MFAGIVLAAALVPIGYVPNGACYERAALADVQPQGAGQTFAARHTIFARDFAFTKFYVHENGGGEILWHRRGARWCEVPQNLTYLDVPALVRLGVPRADARAFRIAAGEYLEAIVRARRNEPSAEGSGKDDD